MPNQTILAACIAAALLSPLAARADLLPQQAGDLAPGALVAAQAARTNTSTIAPTIAPPVTRDAVSFSWRSRDAVTAPKPFVALSREAYFTVTGAELAQGVALPTTAPRAIVRLQPVGEASVRANEAIQPSSLIIIDADGRALSAGEGIETMVSADRLAKSDLPFAAATSAFRLGLEARSGPLRLRANGLADSQRYLVNVVEPDSPLALTMQATAATYLQGQQLTVLAQLQNGAAGVTPGRIDATLVSPAGRSLPLVFKRGADGRMAATVTLDAGDVDESGLWEVQANVTATVDGRRALRTSRFAVAVAAPTAKLARATALGTDGDALTVQLGVTAASAARYEVRGVLYGTVQGRLVPLGVGNAAKWIEAGDGSIALPFGADLLAGSTGPYEVRDLLLLDQGRRTVLQRQQRALTMDEGEVARLLPQRAATVPPSSARVKKTANAQ